MASAGREGPRAVEKKPTKVFEAPENAPESRDFVYYKMAGRKRYAHGGWYRGDHVNFHPMRESLAEPDAFETYVGSGWLPAQPVIDRSCYVTAFGSCFAQEVTKFLKRAGYRVFGDDLNLNAHIIRSGEGLVNSAAVLQQFQWAYGEKSFSDRLWRTKDGEVASNSEDIQENTKKIFQQTDVFIITFGLSEVWYEKETGDVFWRAIPSAQFEAEKHGFRVLGAEENRQNIAETYRLIRAARPEARVIFTLSPVPLAATFRPISCITADAVSKASLRVAIDEVMREFSFDKNLFYFPSFELVKTVIPDAYGDDLRHPRPETVAAVMRMFQKAFLK